MFKTGSQLVYNVLSGRPGIVENMPDLNLKNNKEHCCIMCRDCVEEGVLLDNVGGLRKFLPSTFVEYADIKFDVEKDGCFICKYCLWLLTTEIMAFKRENPDKPSRHRPKFTHWPQRYMKGIITTKEIYVFNNSCRESSFGEQVLPNSQFVDWLFNPPEPPFLFYVLNQEKVQAHVFWKARVSLSRDMFFIQFAPRPSCEILVDRGELKRIVDDVVSILVKYGKYISSYLVLFGNDFNFLKKVRKQEEENELLNVVLDFRRKLTGEYKYLFSKKSNIGWSDYIKKKVEEVSGERFGGDEIP